MVIIKAVFSFSMKTFYDDDDDDDEDDDPNDF